MEIELLDGNKQDHASRPLLKKPHGGRLIPPVLRPGNLLLVKMQELFNKIFTPSLNPLYYLGAIIFFLFWVLLATGTYLYLFYDMTPSGAYQSVQYITENQEYYGGIIRSTHRYAADGIIMVIIIHIFQVFFSDRFRRYRQVAWVSGAAILPAIWFEGVSGYFLVWDKTAQMIAVMSARIFDAIPIYTEPMPRNFLTNDSVSATLFFVFNYLHLAIPLLLLILAWIHCMRISMPVINPPKPLRLAILVLLLALSTIKPAISAGSADLSLLVGIVPIDWFYLAPFPIIDWFKLSPGLVWLGAGASYMVMLSLPWIIPEPIKPKAQKLSISQGAVTINPTDCKGCILCQHACPFEAMKLTPKVDGLPGEMEAKVVPALCAECGFCVGTCEFGAISMGDWNKSDFQGYIETLFANEVKKKRPETMAFICERSFDYEGFFTADGTRIKECDEVASMVIPCIGIISPAILEYCFTAGAKGVLVVGCRGMDCHYRESRRRLKVDDNPKDLQFLVEKMGDPRIKIMFISPFEVEQLIEDIKYSNNKFKSNATGD